MGRHNNSEKSVVYSNHKAESTTTLTSSVKGMCLLNCFQTWPVEELRRIRSRLSGQFSSSSAPAPALSLDVSVSDSYVYNMTFPSWDISFFCLSCVRSVTNSPLARSDPNLNPVGDPPLCTLDSAHFILGGPGGKGRAETAEDLQSSAHVWKQWHGWSMKTWPPRQK